MCSGILMTRERRLQIIKGVISSSNWLLLFCHGGESHLRAGIICTCHPALGGTVLVLLKRACPSAVSSTRTTAKSLKRSPPPWPGRGKRIICPTTIAASSRVIATRLARILKPARLTTVAPASSVRPVSALVVTILDTGGARVAASPRREQYSAF